jgi:hypothetical protein
MLRLNEDRVHEAAAALEGISSSVLKFNFTASHYFLKSRYIDIEYHRTDNIDSLQAGVIEKCNPLRLGLPKASEHSLANSEGEARSNLEMYGYKPCGKLFRPHMTFTRFSKDVSVLPEGLPDPHYFSGSFVAVGLFKIDENGTCISRVASYELKD